MPEHDPSFFPAVACAQFNIELGEPQSNLAALEGLLERSSARLAAGTLVVLPEMWATGFRYADCERFAEATPGLLADMRRLAAKHGILLAGSLTAQDADATLPTNRLFVVAADGVLGYADKQHPFAAWHEEEYYRPGQAGGPLAAPIQTPFGPLGAVVCYDLRFPEVAREQAFAGCRLFVVSAEWPESRLDHWRTLIRARAIENQSFVAACNACGRTGKLVMAGHSLIVAPDGEILAEAEAEPGLLAVSLDTTRLDAARHLFCVPAERPWRYDSAAKICTLPTLLPRLEAMRHQAGADSHRPGARVAFTNGCFDLLHAGHVAYLEAARKTADCLIVGLNSDASVRLQGKGADRPVQNEADRARILAALACVDFVVLFDEPTPLSLIRAIRPIVLVKGADWPEDQIAGAAEVKAAGGLVLRIPLASGRSTTAIIRRIRGEADAESR